MVVAERIGVQEPRISLVPDYVSSRLDEVLEVCDACGIELDEWQKTVLRDASGVGADGLFSAMEVGVNVARQNGKGVVLMARELAGIFAFGEELVTHSSQMMDTSLEHMQRIVDALEEGDLQKEIKGKPRWANGKEMIEFNSGQRIRFRTRSRSGGRGFSGALVVLDEAMFVDQAAKRALMPILSTKKDGQFWYAGSAVDQQEMAHGVVWSEVRERALERKSKSLAYFEWSADIEKIEDVPEELDLDLIAQANPAFGIRISERYIRMEREGFGNDLRGFAVERLGVGDWSSTDGLLQSVIDPVLWDELGDPDSEVLDPVCLAFDVSPERKAAVGAAGKTSDGRWHVEVVKAQGGTSWLPAFLLDKVERNDPLVVVADAYGPVASIIAQVEEAGVTVETITAGEHGQACGRLVDAVADRELCHIGQPSLSSAVKGAATRPLGDAWAWSRKNSNVDISPLVAVTLALSAAMERVDQAGELTIY